MKNIFFERANSSYEVYLLPGGGDDDDQEPGGFLQLTGRQALEQRPWLHTAAIFAVR